MRTSKRTRLLYLGFAFVFALLFDLLFWEKELGLNFFLLVSAYIAGFLALGFSTKEIRQTWALFLFLPAAAMSFAPVLYTNAFTTSWTLVFVAFFLALGSLLSTYQSEPHATFSFWNIKTTKDPLAPFFQIGTIWKDITTLGKEDKGNVLKKTLLGVLISLPILLIFSSLFSAADPIFRDWMSGLFDFGIHEDTVWRIFRTLLLTGFLGVIMYTLLDKRHVLENTTHKVLKFDETILTVMFALVNLLFLIFVFIQFKYLFGQAVYVQEQSLSFSSYAREGFFQLTAVMFFSALLILASYWSRATHGMRMHMKGLKLLLIVQVGVIAASALHRMNLYQAEFGFTVLRLYVEWFIYFTFIALVFTAIGIIINWKFQPFFYGLFCAGAAAMTIVSLINVDAMIAKENVDRAILEGKELDLDYLYHELSSDAAREVLRAGEHGYTLFEGYERGGTKYFTVKDGWSTESHVDTQKGYARTIERYDSWLELNWSVEQLRRAL